MMMLNSMDEENIVDAFRIGTLMSMLNALVEMMQQYDVLDWFRIGTLILSGIIQILVGSSRLNSPLNGGSKGKSTSKPEPDVDHQTLSEIRGIGGIQLCSGAVMAYGGYVSYQLALSNKVSELDLLIVASSHIVGIILFGGFTIGKILSLMIDGSSGDASRLNTGFAFHMMLHIANIVCFTDLLYQYEMMT